MEFFLYIFSLKDKFFTKLGAFLSHFHLNTFYCVQAETICLTFDNLDRNKLKFLLTLILVYYILEYKIIWNKTGNLVLHM